MKKFLAALALVAATAAAAEVIATAPTTAGGEIRLTDDECSDKTYGKFFAYIRTSEGEMFIGCWQTLDGDVFISFKNGRKRLYDIKGFEIKPGFAARRNKNSM